MSDLTQISLGAIVGVGLLFAFLVWAAFRDRRPEARDKKDEPPH